MSDTTMLKIDILLTPKIPSSFILRYYDTFKRQRRNVLKTTGITF
jgi:hypothetical protein